MISRLQSPEKIRDKLIFVLPLISVLLLIFTLPKFNLNHLVWVSLIPLFFFLEKVVNKKQLIWGCLIAGFFYALAVVWPLTSLNSWWIVGPDIDGFFWNNKELLLKMFMVIFSVYCGSFIFLLFGLFYKKLVENSLRDAFMVPLLWVLLEILREFMVLGFTWGQLGYTMHNSLPILQITSIGGVYSLSFLIISVNVLIFLWLKKFLCQLKKEGFIKNITYIFVNRFSFTLFIIFFLVFLFGYISIWQESKESGRDTLSVALIHPMLTTPESATLEGHNLYLSLIEKAVSNNPDVVVLPENSLPWIVIEEKTGLPANYPKGNTTRNQIFEKITSLSEENPGLSILIGLHTLNKKGRFNSLVSFKGGKVEGVYNKKETLPVFETSPDFLKKSHIAPIEKPSKKRGGAEVSSGNLKIGALICSEISFPRLFRAENIDFIVNSSNDSVFDSPLVGDQHHIMAKFRAVENRKYLLRSVKGGISSIINPYGRVIKGSEGKTPVKIIFGDIVI